MGDMGVIDELKGGTGVDWCGTWSQVLRWLKGLGVWSTLTMEEGTRW